MMRSHLGQEMRFKGPSVDSNAIGLDRGLLGHGTTTGRYERSVCNFYTPIGRGWGLGQGM